MPVLGAGYVGDYVEDYATLNLKFTSYSTAWVPIALAGSPVVKVYAANETGTEVTTGIALAVDFDGVVGLNNVLIDLSSAAFYAVAKDYHVIVTTGTIDGVSAVGTVVGSFSIENRFVGAGAIADAVWDEVLTGNSHNDATSAGKRLRQAERAIVHADGTIATATNAHTFTLDAGAVATADYYVGDRLEITEGTGAGQSRIIAGYTVGKVVTLDSDFTTSPDASSLYAIVAADVHVSLSDADLATGFVATATNTTTITLDSAAVATTDYYKGEIIVFPHGTGSGQSREITAYTSGRVVTMSPALETAVDTTTSYHVVAAVSVPEIVDEILTTQMTEAYAANGVAPTLAQCQFAVHQMLMQFGISGTNLTVRKLDDSSPAFVAILDDADSPTSIKRV